METKDEISRIKALKKGGSTLKSTINNMKSQLNSAESVLGKYYGYELIEIEKTGKSLIGYSYLVKYERNPMTFVMVYYKLDKFWTLLN